MAAKASTQFLIPNENASILLVSTITNTRLSSSSSVNHSTRKTRRKQDLCFMLPSFSRSSYSAIQATSGSNSNEPNSPSNLQDNLSYLLKLIIGSIVGAAMIKYGSAAIPDITKPNISQALWMISSPVIVAVLLLFKESER